VNGRYRLLLAGLVLAAAPGLARAEFLIGLTANNSLVSFNSRSPGVGGPEVAITGLAADDTLAGIDFRPATGGLYALNQAGTTLYVIDPFSGAVTQTVGLSSALGGSFFGFDFNPVADRLRVVTDAGSNFSIDVDTGEVTAQTDLAFVAGDLNDGAVPLVVAAAYTNSFAGAASTTLYGIHAEGGYLVTQTPPPSGQLATVGLLPLGPPTSPDASFDISGRSGRAYAVLNGLNLSRVNLATGRAVEEGEIAAPAFIVGLAVDVNAASVPAPPAAVLLGTGLAAGVIGRRSRRHS
jgi:hypothetical protein